MIYYMKRVTSVDEDKSIVDRDVKQSVVDAAQHIRNSA